jgi:hypothetical protein
MHGRGFYDFGNGETYEGYLKKGLRDGKGIYTWRDMSFYSGFLCLIRNLG